MRIYCVLVLFFTVSFKNLIAQKPEPHRPLYHFTPPTQWMNDPNGMVYYKGEYHLFYQYYPDSTIWGPMHWGHAVSKNLIHWQHLPIALYPDSLGYIFSGSAVVDVNNTSGLGKKGGEAPLVAIFTYHDMAGEKANRTDFQTQGIAYSLDKGRTWTKYSGNPVIKNTGIKDFRDPKVFWHTASKYWIMILAVADHVEFYASKNLKQWDKVGEFGKNEGAHAGVWECPDLFPMKVVGENNSKWVLTVSINPGAPNGGSGTQYFVGHFDGKNFKNDNTPDKTLWLDYGKDNYAGVTWSGNTDGRRLSIGWMSNWQYAQIVPTTAWRSANTIPRELSLHRTAEGLRVFQKPVKEFSILRGQSVNYPTMKIKDSKILDKKSTAKEIELSIDLSKTTATDWGLILSNNKNEKLIIGYDIPTKRFYIDRTESGKIDFSKDFAVKQYAPRLSQSPILKIKVLVDVASVEVFADNGSTTLTSIFFPNEDFKTTEFFSKNGHTYLDKATVWQLNMKRM